MAGNPESKQTRHSERLAKSLLDTVVTVVAGTLWEGVHLEVTVVTCSLVAHFCG